MTTHGRPVTNTGWLETTTSQSMITTGLSMTTIGWSVTTSGLSMSTTSLSMTFNSLSAVLPTFSPECFPGKIWILGVRIGHFFTKIEGFSLEFWIFRLISLK